MKVERLERSPSAEDGKEAAGGRGGQPDSVKGPWEVRGSRRVQHSPPRFYAAFPSSSPEAEGGALRSGAETARPRPPPTLRRQQPEDSYPNMELGFPRPRPRPRPAGRHRLAIRGGRTARFGAWQRGRVGGRVRDT